MNTYNLSRNFEASIIQYLETELTSSWSNIVVEKSFARVYDLTLPVVCIRCGVTDHVKAEIGEDATIRNAEIMIDIFATSDGQKLDIKDFIVDKIKAGIPYYEYTINNGTIQDKTLNGRMRVTDIGDAPINFDSPKDDLDKHDRYRHLLTLNISLGKVEE